MLLLGIAIFTCFQVIAAAPSKYSNRTVCTTDACYDAANYFINSMDTNVNPCDNFYNFVCGKYVEDTVIPEGEYKIDVFTELAIKLDNQLKNLIEENSLVLETKASQLIEQLYKGCINNYANIFLALTSIDDLLFKLGGCPLLQDGDWSSIDWKEITYTLRQTGAATNDYIPVSVYYHRFDANKYSLNILLPTFLISQASLQQGLDNEQVQAYKQIITDFTVSLGTNDVEYTKEMVAKLLDFEIELAQIAVESEEATKTIADLEDSYPNIPWKTYLTNMIGSPTVEMLDQDLVTIGSIGYIQNLNVLLQNTSPEILGSYLQFRAAANIMTLVGGLGWGKTKLNNGSFGQLLESRTLKADYPEVCVTLVRTQLPMALSALYVKKFLTASIKDDVADLILKLKDTFIKVLEDNTWVDEQTRDGALTKVKAMGFYAGYPDELVDDALVDEYYEKVKLDDNYVNIQFNIHKFSTDVSFGKVKDVPDKADWRTHCELVQINAYYNFYENRLQILAAFVQNPTFRQGNPNYMNYGAIASVIGHEINHGFDAIGSRFDEFGQQHNWFTNESFAEFEKRAMCLYEQYITHNGNPTASMNTLNENMADAGGVSSSYIAYQNWVNDNHEDSLLPGLNYTPNQFFWMSYARVWCAHETDYFINVLSPYQTHALGRYRVVVPLTNIPKFSEDFNCPIGSFMNPIHKCNIW